jgi:hypothetical protein
MLWGNYNKKPIVLASASMMGSATNLAKLYHQPKVAFDFFIRHKSHAVQDLNTQPDQLMKPIQGIYRSPMYSLKNPDNELLKFLELFYNQLHRCTLSVIWRNRNCTDFDIPA